MEQQGVVLLSRLRIDGGTQPRVAISESAVEEYADFMRTGTVLPPVDVFFDGTEYWLADGFHRYHAAQRLNLEYIRVVVHTGTRRDAVLFSVGVNQAHGLRRTNQDKGKAVRTLLSDDEWGRWSDSEIARRCGVSQSFVGDIRRGFRTRSAASGHPLKSDLSEPRTYITKHGTETTMKVEKIGRTRRGVTKDAARQTDYEARKAVAIEGASSAVLKRLPKKQDAEIVDNTVQALRGILSAFATVDPAPLSNHPRVEDWRLVIAETIGVLRSFNKRLERRAV